MKYKMFKKYNHSSRGDLFRIQTSSWYKEHSWLLHEEEDIEVSNILCNYDKLADLQIPLAASEGTMQKEILSKYYLVLHGRRSSVMQSLRKLKVSCDGLNGLELERLILDKKFPIPYFKWKNYAQNLQHEVNLA